MIQIKNKASSCKALFHERASIQIERLLFFGPGTYACPKRVLKGRELA